MQGGVGFRAEVGIGKETWMRAKETRDEGGIVEVDCAAEADGRFDPVGSGVSDVGGEGAAGFL